MRNTGVCWVLVIIQTWLVWSPLAVAAEEAVVPSTTERSAGLHHAHQSRRAQQPAAAEDTRTAPHDCFNNNPKLPRRSVKKLKILSSAQSAP